MKGFFPCKNVFIVRWKQILIILALVQVAMIAFIYFKESWIRDSKYLWANLEYKKDIVKYENNPTFNSSIYDEKRLLNLTDFSYKIHKDSVCQNGSILLLVLVSSAPANQLNRNLIRETWGQQDQEVKIVFILGDSENPNDNESLQIEDRNFSDIVQGNFLDSYKNLTYKSIMGLKFAINNCPDAKFIMRCDDDMFVNLPLLKNFLKNDVGFINPKNTLFCTVNDAGTPIRDSMGEYRKWYVSYDEWPEEHFPVYCSGWFYIATRDAVHNLYREAQNTTYLWIDDVFLTGIVARKVHGLRYVDLLSFTLERSDTDFDKMDLSKNLGKFPFLFGTMNMVPEDIRVLWKFVLSRPVRESIFYITSFTID